MESTSANRLDRSKVRFGAEPIIIKTTFNRTYTEDGNDQPDDNDVVDDELA